MAASDATPWPIKNQAYRVTFPILDADGDLVTGATGLDSEVSTDGGTFADCTNEATEIATASGVYYLDLTAGEMNADTVAIIVKTSSSGAKTTTLILYPITNGLDLPVNVTYFGGSAGTFSGGRPEVNTTHAAGTAWASGAITAASIASDAITAAKIATGAIDADAIAADAITAAKIADGAIDAATFATGAVLDAAGVATAVWNAATTSYGGAGTYGQAVEDILVDTGTDIPASIADLPTNAELSTALGTADDAVLAAIAALNDITVADIIAGVADGSYDLQEMMRVIFAACAGKSSGHESGTPAYRDAADTKNRISATTDANGNRTAVTLDAT